MERAHSGHVTDCVSSSALLTMEIQRRDETQDFDVEHEAQKLAFQEARRTMTREQEWETMGSELFHELVPKHRHELFMLLHSEGTDLQYNVMYASESASSSPLRLSPKKKREASPSPTISPVPAESPTLSTDLFLSNLDRDGSLVVEDEPEH